MHVCSMGLDSTAGHRKELADKHFQQLKQQLEAGTGSRDLTDASAGGSATNFDDTAAMACRAILRPLIKLIATPGDRLNAAKSLGS